MKGPDSHWEWGTLSGYPKCCQVWFHVRLWLMNHTSWWKWTKKYSNWFSKRIKFRHVLCPCHHGLALLRFYKPKYFNCAECGWHQFGSGPCRIENLHESWRRHQLREWYFRGLMAGYRVKAPGRMMKEIQKEFANVQPKPRDRS